MLDDEIKDEQLAVEARFRALVAEWDLGRSQVAALLGVDADELGLDLVPRVPDRVPERRLRMLVEVRSLLRSLVPDVRDVPLWLRTAMGCDEDDAGDDTATEGSDGSGTPLAFLSGPIANVVAFRNVLRARAA